MKRYRVKRHDRDIKCGHRSRPIVSWVSRGYRENSSFMRFVDSIASTVEEHGMDVDELEKAVAIVKEWKGESS